MTDTSPASNARNYPLLAVPHVQLHGPVDDAMYDSFKAQVAAAPTEGPLVVSITTLGGDPEMARAMGDHIRLLREYTDRETLFLGKVAVYSAGATFPPTAASSRATAA
jgi:ATP-dependent Clp protease protease subunit